MSTINTFQINVAQDTLNDLQQRLERTRWTDETNTSNWSYGTDSTYLRELVDYWRNTYDWRKQEESLNKLPQFTTEIDGITVHFIHVRGQGKQRKPLLLIHGWPDSFYRFYKLVPLLTEYDNSFDLVIPSIPGFGFSGHQAVNSDQTAKLFNTLMCEVLGYDSYYAAGGDMGSMIAKSVAVQFPQNVKAIHLTDVGYPDGSENWAEMSPAEQQFGQYIQHWFFTEGAFNMIQSTKPQTLGFGLNDSPVGLAAWIIEKFYAWSDNGGNIENSFTKDELLTNIMIYWVGQTINSSICTYAENAKASYSGGLKSSHKVQVPTGVSLFPGEAQFPREWAERKCNLASFRILNKGGHFAALELPYLYAVELKEFFGQIEADGHNH